VSSDSHGIYYQPPVLLRSKLSITVNGQIAEQEIVLTCVTFIERDLN
jgi:hypothetical protein